MYRILPYTYRKASELGVMVFPSDHPHKKIDIYDHRGIYLFSGGAKNAMDFPHYIEQNGKEYANERRRLYRIRHKKELKKPNTRGWYIAHLLW